MLYEVKTSNWGQDIEIFDHNDKSVLKAYYKKKNWYSPYYYLISEINDEQFEITTPVNFWRTKLVIKINNDQVGDITYKSPFGYPYYKIVLNGNEYSLKNYKKILNHKNEMLIRVRTKTTFTKSFVYLETNTDVFKEDVPYLLLITLYMFRTLHRG
jgi:hypothetical protein